MKQAMALALSFALAVGVVGAQAQQGATTAPKKTTARKRAVAKPDAVAAQLTELKQALDAQQQQIKQLSDQVQSRDQQIQQLQQKLDASTAATTEAQSKAEAAASQASAQAQSVDSLKSDVADLKSNNTNSALTLQETQKTIQEMGSPVALHYKGITITPGGFIDASSVTRTRATSSDINTPFNSIPYPGNELSRLTESNFSGRHSRLSLLGEGKAGTTKLTGYWEADFFGTGVTSNNRQSNSYVLRQRVLYGQAALKNGLSFSVGQMWSLLTEDRKGIDNRQEIQPLTIDPQYNVGYSWARQYGFRVVKDFGGKAAVGFSVEGPQATIGGRGFSSVVTSTSGITTATGGNTILDAAGAGGGLLNFADTTGYSINKSPDVIVKAAFDPGWGHYEIFGLYSTFRNRVYPCGVAGTNAKDTTTPPAALVSITCPIDGTTTRSTVGAYNDTVNGGGGGANFRLPLVPKKLELAAQGMYGDGVGRYGSAQIPDLTFHPNGTEALIRTGHGMGGLELHLAKLDAYGYYGAEYGARTAYKGYNVITVTATPKIPATSTSAAIPATTTTAFGLNQIGGYGSRFANNSGCATETLPSNNLTGQFPPPAAPFNPTAGTCAGDTRVISQGTVGFWYKFYQGPKGGFRFGLQYSYFTRNGWSGNNSLAGTSSAAGFAPKAIDNMFWTSIRYYLP